MNDLFIDVGYNSINKYGEQLCGDHVDMVTSEDGSKVIVLADGLGSGVKASILSTLTAKMISTMLAANLSVEECIKTIAKVLPVCSERKVAYSTFTIIRITDNKQAEIIQFDNPNIILLRDGKNLELPLIQNVVDGKKISYSKTELKENDTFVAVSDGVIYAGPTENMNYDWQRKDVIEFMETFAQVGFTAKTLTTVLLDECLKLYNNKPADDTTVCVIKVRKREPMNILFGPPLNISDQNKMLILFFSKRGQHIVCGGTTSKIVSEYLGKPIKTELTTAHIINPDIPPVASIEGVDLVTEGVITMGKVLEYARNYLDDNAKYREWGYSTDGASKVARLLFEKATDINFFVGKAVNPAHQLPDMAIDFDLKMQIVNELTKCLNKMGKNVKVIYF